MADVRPFRAVRYADPAPEVTAPPYDVIGPEERAELAARDPHNVVHLTLAGSAKEAGERYRAWLDEGVLVEEERPALWALAQEYVGPDRVARRREGLVASLRVEPYETGAVLPHERTHAGPKEDRLRLLRAVHAQLEPIFLLYDGDAPVAVPERAADLEAEGTALWRLDGDGEFAAAAEFFRDRQLLIADGHHRYETAVAFAAEQGTDASARMLVVLVSTSDPGLEIFATHRVFASADSAWASTPADDVEEAVTSLEALPYDRARALLYRGGAAALVDGEPGELDVDLVERLVGHDGIRYTPDWRDAVAIVDAGDAEGAFLLRPTRIEDVFSRAREGRTMPPKATYFFPKLRSGLLFHPL